MRAAGTRREEPIVGCSVSGCFTRNGARDRAYDGRDAGSLAPGGHSAG